MTIGYKTISTEIYKKYNLDSYHIPEVYNIEEQIQGNHVSDIMKSDDSISYKETTAPSTVLSPMNSSWPTYCHDVRHTGQSQYSTVNTAGVEKWRIPLAGWVMGSPVIDKNYVIYVGSNDFFALYPNGTVKWVYDTGRIWSAPAIDENGIIYVGSVWAMPNYLYAFYPDGTLKWKYVTGDSVYSSPVIGNDGTIYFGQSSGDTGYIKALYSNGTLRWAYHTNGVVYSSPAIGSDGTIYCGSHDGGLYALYSNNGTVKWRFGTGGWVRTAPCIAEDGTIYCVSVDNYLYAVYPNGTMKWRTNVGAGTSPTIGQDGTIYAGWSDLYAVNPTNGSIKWVFDPGPDRCIEGGTPAHSADGTIYCGVIIRVGDISQGGEIIAINPNGTEQWRNTIADFQVESAPAISEDGTVYIGSSWEPSNGYLHAFGPGEPKKIVIQQPEPGKLYLFGLGVSKTLLGNTVIIGSVNVKVHAYSWNEIISVHFYIDGTDQYNLTKPPFEWRMNQRYGNLFPLKHTITVTGFYKGSYSWSESIDVLYFHLYNK
jgi:outer membrane protein assembly factor BamB